ncbi:hypothetical protein ACA910_004704 [Epithemia clementina (nom. ined.)]
MRRQFPGPALFTDPRAPKLLIRTCLGLCGGLHDRLGQLPWDLYLAQQTHRVLLLHWHRPVSLEHFLQPPTTTTTTATSTKWSLDWRVPPEIPGFFPKSYWDAATNTTQYRRVVSRSDMNVVRNGYPDMFLQAAGGELAEQRPTLEFWHTEFPRALEQAKTSQHNILRHRLLGHLHESILEDRLRQQQQQQQQQQHPDPTVGDEGDAYWNVHAAPWFGRIFDLFFQPSPAVQAELERVRRDELHLSSTSLTMSSSSLDGVHVRVRHPKATPQNVLVKGKNQEYTADKSGLPWSGETRAFAIAMATHALACADTLQPLQQSPQLSNQSSQRQRQRQRRRRPIYLFSDSNDLVTYFAQQLQDPQYLAHHAQDFETQPADRAALAWMQSHYNHHNATQPSTTPPILVARNVSTTENVHLDRQKGRPPEAYFGTFVDLYLARQATCVTFGIGYYAVFATKLSGTTCKLLYQDDAWSSSSSRNSHAAREDGPRQRLHAPLCALPPPVPILTTLTSLTSNKKKKTEKS